MTKEGDVLYRFWGSVAKTDGCWLWKHKANEKGYGTFWFRGKNHRAHRFSLAVHGIEISEQMVVDHLCRNRGCVNPSHLRIVDPRTNILENSVGLAAINAKKSFCKRGHPFAGHNLILIKTGRACRSCALVRSAAYKRKIREKRKSLLPSKADK